MSKPTLITGPTFEEMLHPDKIDPHIRQQAVTMMKTDPLHPINLFNISWRDPHGRIYYEILPPALTGVECPIVVLHAEQFPTRSHKVGATYSGSRRAEREVDPQTTLLPSSATMHPGAYVAVV